MVARIQRQHVAASEMPNGGWDFSIKLVMFALLLLQPTVLRSLLAPSHWGSTPSSRFKVGMVSRRFTPEGAYDWRGTKTHALVTTIWYPAADL
jgi:hypothetical protein